MALRIVLAFWFKLLKYRYTLAVRSKILSKLIFARCA